MIAHATEHRDAGEYDEFVGGALRAAAASAAPPPPALVIGLVSEKQLRHGCAGVSAAHGRFAARHARTAERAVDGGAFGGGTSTVYCTDFASASA